MKISEFFLKYINVVRKLCLVLSIAKASQLPIMPRTTSNKFI